MSPCAGWNENMKKQSITLAYALIFSALILAIPHIARSYYHHGIIPGEEPYYHADSARNIIERDFSGISISDNPYHIALAFTGSIIGIELASKLMPFAFGMLSALVFFLILSNFKLKENEKLIIMLILVASPPFIYLFAFSAYHTLPVFLTLLGIYLLLCKKRILIIISIIPFLLSMLFGPFNFLLTIAILASYSAKSRSRIVLFLLFFALSFSALFLPLYLYERQEIMPRDSTERLKEAISDLGGLYGISSFAVLLSLASPFFIWKDIKKQGILLIPLLLILAGLYYSSFTILYLNFIISILAGITLISIASMKWHLDMIRNLTLTLLFCGLLFSSVSYLNRIADLDPDRNTARSLEWLGTYSSENEIVLSHYSRGFWIRYFSRSKPMLDPRFEYGPEAAEKYNDANEIFYSRSLESTRELLSKHNIKYIWIDQEMKTGLVWAQEEQGLLFLFRNNETFKNIYDFKGIEIWEVLK